MNNSEYHRASASVLNWKRLSIPMKARYGGWIIKSTSSWTVNYMVTVTHHNGRRLNKQPQYPFEYEADAKICVQWWADNDCLAEVKEI